MKNTEEYKGFTGQYEFLIEESEYYGKIIGIKDLITFYGATPVLIEAEFISAVDDYIYTKRLIRLNELMDAKAGTPEGDELKTLAVWIQDYEEKNCDIPELTQKEIDDYESGVNE